MPWQTSFIYGNTVYLNIQSEFETQAAGLLKVSKVILSKRLLCVWIQMNRTIVLICICECILVYVYVLVGVSELTYASSSKVSEHVLSHIICHCVCNLSWLRQNVYEKDFTCTSEAMWQIIWQLKIQIKLKFCNKLKPP